MVAPAPSRGRVAVSALVIVAAILAAYHNCFDTPFVFDDVPAIVENPTVRRLWPLGEVLMPPRGEGVTVEGRPIVNLTLALNYAIGGTAVRGYHGFNVLVHALAALTLFGLIRRTLLLPRFAARFGEAALPLATMAALLWALHPLQTESVTYVIQRAESLVALFYLLTLYASVRAMEDRARAPGGPHSTGRDGLPGGQALPWAVLAVLACLLGMATKENMVSAPLLVLLFDRVFVSGSFRAAWRERGRLHVALFATWLLLAFLVARTGTRGGTAGFGINVTPWQYALTQFEAVTRYAWLSFWPQPLIFDYGVAWVQRASDVLPYAITLLAMIAATIVAWRRWPAAAWLGTLFFAVLSPTSSFVPGNRQTLAEHRMYLPLAAIIVLVVCAVYLVGRRRGVWIAGLAAVAFALLTVRRNHDYRTEIALYEDTARKRPANGFARYNLGKAYAEAGRHPEALAEYEAALRQMAASPGIHYNLGNSLVALGRRDEAIARFQAAVRLDPGYARAHFNLGNALIAAGRQQEAATHFAAAVADEPGYVEARANLGGVLLELGQVAEARRQFEEVLRRAPDSVEALFGLGNACLLEERWAEAARAFEQVVALRPELAVARERLELARSKMR